MTDCRMHDLIISNLVQAITNMGDPWLVTQIISQKSHTDQHGRPMTSWLHRAT